MEVYYLLDGNAGHSLVDNCHMTDKYVMQKKYNLTSLIEKDGLLTTVLTES